MHIDDCLCQVVPLCFGRETDVLVRLHHTGLLRTSEAAVDYCDQPIRLSEKKHRGEEDSG